MSERGPDRRFLSVGEVAAMAGVSVDTVRTWDRQHILPARRSPGGQRRFHIEDVELFLHQREGRRGASVGGRTPREPRNAGTEPPEGGVQLRGECQTRRCEPRTIVLDTSGGKGRAMGVRQDQHRPSANSAADLADYAAHAERVRRETEDRLDAIHFESLKTYGRACATGVPAEWMAYVVRDLETYVTAVQFPRGLSAWDAQSFVEARVKRLLQPYRDEVARREEAESRRKKLANLMEFGRRHLRRETFLLPKEEAEEVEGEVERDMVRRMKWNWS